MKRALIAAMISGALALSTAVPLSVFGMESLPAPVPVPVPDPVSDSAPCSVGDASRVLASEGCCRRQGGICGCRNGKARCCDGTPGAGCSCRGDSTPSEEL
jgi:hypothetical protein